MIKKELSQVIKKSTEKYLSSIGVNETPKIEIEYAADEKFGDYASAVAMRLSKQLKKNPFEIAAAIVEDMDKTIFEKVEIAKPGFINMTLSKKFINENINNILVSQDYQKGLTENPKKIQIEYVSANPTGPLHIGHGRWAAIGDTLYRILTYAGHNVEREFYVNDAGEQIAKLNATIDAVKNGQDIPEDGYHGDYIKDIAKMEGVPKDILLNEQKRLLKKFGCEFENFASEQAVKDKGEVEKAIKFLQAHGYLFEENGALWFRSSSFGDDKDRVLQKSDGSYTYFAGDIAYHKTKVERGYDLLINILGADHHGYVARITAAVKTLGENKTELNVIIGQLVRLFRGKEPVRMSKRTGDIITLEEVIDEIGVDSTRYFLIMRSPNTTLDFDLELAKKHDNDNPVYYAQYAYARICNIFVKREEKELSFDAGKKFDITKTDNNTSVKLAKIILHFADEIYLCASLFEVHHIVSYVHELSAAFHRFYYENTVLDENEEVRNNRLLLALATKKILGICFDIIGIEKLQRMWNE